MDITPVIPEGHKVIEAYGDGGFRITGERYEGSVLLFPTRVLAWQVGVFSELTLESLAPVAEAAPAILLLGCGTSMEFVPKDIRATLRAGGTVIEHMDTGAACRTYNFLLSEGRDVAAALISV